MPKKGKTSGANVNPSNRPHFTALREDAPYMFKGPINSFGPSRGKGGKKGRKPERDLRPFPFGRSKVPEKNANPKQMPPTPEISKLMTDLKTTTEKVQNLLSGVNSSCAGAKRNSDSCKPSYPPHKTARLSVQPQPQQPNKHIVFDVDEGSSSADEKPPVVNLRRVKKEPVERKQQNHLDEGPKNATPLQPKKNDAGETAVLPYHQHYNSIAPFSAQPLPTGSYRYEKSTDKATTATSHESPGETRHLEAMWKLAKQEIDLNDNLERLKAEERDVEDKIKNFKRRMDSIMRAKLEVSQRLSDLRRDKKRLLASDI